MYKRWWQGALILFAQMPDPNDPQATSGAAGGRGGMDGFGGVPNSFDAVIEAALEEAEALPDFSASE